MTGDIRKEAVTKTAAITTNAKALPVGSELTIVLACIGDVAGDDTKDKEIGCSSFLVTIFMFIYVSVLQVGIIQIKWNNGKI